MSRTFHHRKARTKRANGWCCTCWHCIGSKAYERKNNPPMPYYDKDEEALDEYQVLCEVREALMDEDGTCGECWGDGGFDGQAYCSRCSPREWLWAHPSQELAATIQEHVAYRWTGRPLPFARKHRNDWRRRLTRRFLASRYWRSERHTEVFSRFILDLTRKPLTHR